MTVETESSVCHSDHSLLVTPPLFGDVQLGRRESVLAVLLPATVQFVS